MLRLPRSVLRLLEELAHKMHIRRKALGLRGALNACCATPSNDVYMMAEDKGLKSAKHKNLNAKDE